LKIKEIKPSFKNPGKGSLLISEPFLDDINFRRAVILLAEKNELGSVGFILNRPLDMLTSEVVPDLLELDFALYYGGPVEPNTLHFIHKYGELIPGSYEVLEGVYWGGDINTINDLLSSGEADEHGFRFFLGYSGWDADQLSDEIKEKAWWIGDADKGIIFNNDMENLWANVVKHLGEDFAHMANPPEDVHWN
jgi:putative transcriptional regulator